MQHKHTLFTLICCAFTVVGGCGKRDADPSLASGSIPSVSIIPAPRDVVPGSGQFAVTTNTSVTFEQGSAAEPVANYFVDLLQRTGGLALQAEGVSSDRIVEQLLDVVPPPSSGL